MPADRRRDRPGAGQPRARHRLSGLAGHRRPAAGAAVRAQALRRGRGRQYPGRVHQHPLADRALTPAGLAPHAQPDPARRHRRTGSGHPGLLLLARRDSGPGRRGADVRHRLGRLGQHDPAPTGGTCVELVGRQPDLARRPVPDRRRHRSWAGLAPPRLAQQRDPGARRRGAHDVLDRGVRRLPGASPGGRRPRRVPAGHEHGGLDAARASLHERAQPDLQHAGRDRRPWPGGRGRADRHVRLGIVAVAAHVLLRGPGPLGRDHGRLGRLRVARLCRLPRSLPGARRSAAGDGGVELRGPRACLHAPARTRVAGLGARARGRARRRLQRVPAHRGVPV